GNGVKIQAQSGIVKNLKDNEVVQGSPAFSYVDFAKSYVHFKNLPKIVNNIEEVKKNNTNK
ncbi:MAG TPA: UDP-3-O-(3-hydroxymyristoyl)glucosamine N-acyltransferase, partial [Flavobacterium sp.]|nr:UDP-3-O-(3-hydroxymyristoyl)glucosamine N-acyltransferase [Flavobacterium sp.]